MIRVIIESPYAGDINRNVHFARACLLDSLKKEEAPFLSHLFYTQVLDDSIPSERMQGIEAGLIWGTQAEKTIVYVDLGISSGMRVGVTRAEIEGRPVEYRRIEAHYRFPRGNQWCPVINNLAIIETRPSRHCSGCLQ